MNDTSELLLIGARGYIGTRLHAHLCAAGHRVSALDRRTDDAGATASGVLLRDYQTLKPAELARFRTVVWLAGHSSVKMATDEPAAAFENNVSGLLRLVDALGPTQRLIYASSASLYSGNESPDHVITEDVIGSRHQNAYDLSKYAFDKLVSTVAGANFCGLRFGTVCGTSPRQRHELLLNSMVRSAVRTGVVNVSNPQARRSVLAMNDLVATIERMLAVVPETGFYNLASYSMSIGEFGAAVAGQLGARVVELPGTGTYTFSVDSTKICRALRAPLRTTLPMLIDELATFYESEAQDEQCKTYPTPRVPVSPALHATLST